MTNSLHTIANKLWTTIVVGGIVGALFGIVAMLWPHLTLSFFIYLFSALIIVISVIALGQSLANLKSDHVWWPSVLFAVCGISVGLFILINPAAAQSFLAILLAVYIISQALLDFAASSYTGDSRTRTPVIAMGILGIIFGLLVIVFPRLATEALVWVVGLYIFAHSIAIEYYAFKIRRHIKQLQKNL